MKIEQGDVVWHKPTGYIGSAVFVSNDGKFVRVKIINSRSTDRLSFAADQLEVIMGMKP